MATCCIQDCGKKVLAKGMCAMHYSRNKKYGDPTKGASKQMRGATLQERYHAYAGKTESGCWSWQSFRDPQGYGRLNIDNKPVLAHRISWELHNGPIPEGMHVLHECDNPPCTNPAHLFLGDQVANNADMMAKGRHNPGHVYGESHGCSILTENQVRAIRGSGRSASVLSTQYGVSRRTIRDIQTMKSWQHLL
jgi:hypothetical protein